MEEYYTELMLEEIRRTDPEFFDYIRGELDSAYTGDEEFDGDDIA